MGLQTLAFSGKRPGVYTEIATKIKSNACHTNLYFPVSFRGVLNSKIALFQLLYLSSLSLHVVQMGCHRGGICAIKFLFPYSTLQLNGYVLDVRYNIQYNETIS